MTQHETIHNLIREANANGFEFHRWFQDHVRSEWPGKEAAVALLMAESRYYALIFSHEFAQAFWKAGARMKFVVPSATYSRLNGKGEVQTIKRKPFTRRTIKADVWRYHLREMATSEDPMCYLRRFLPTHEGAVAENEELGGFAQAQRAASGAEAAI